jgi:hypothetical protein
MSDGLILLGTTFLAGAAAGYALRALKSRRRRRRARMELDNHGRA